MSAEDYRHIVVPFGPACATAGTAASTFRSVGEPGTYVLESAYLMADVTITANATDYATMGLEINGTDAVTDVTSAATTYTAGTQVALTLASGTAIEFDGQTGDLEATCAKAGSGVAVTGAILCRVRKLR